VDTAHPPPVDQIHRRTETHQGRKTETRKRGGAEETRRLLHECQLRLLELEQENQELLAARKGLEPRNNCSERELECKSFTFENMAEAVFFMTPDGNIW